MCSSHLDFYFLLVSEAIKTATLPFFSKLKKKKGGEKSPAFLFRTLYLNVCACCGTGALRIFSVSSDGSAKVFCVLLESSAEEALSTAAPTGRLHEAC